MHCNQTQIPTKHLRSASMHFLVLMLATSACANITWAQADDGVQPSGTEQKFGSTFGRQRLRWATEPGNESGGPRTQPTHQRISYVDDVAQTDESVADTIVHAPEEVSPPSDAVYGGTFESGEPLWEDDYWQGCHEPPAPTCTSGTWFNRGKWYARQDFVYMNRYADNTRQLSADYTNYNPAVVGSRPFEIDETQRTLGFEPGARLTLGRFLCRDSKNRDHSLEFVFFGLFDWQKSNGMIARSEDSLFTLIDPFRTTVDQVGGFNSAQQQSWKYDSSFDSFELNYVLGQRLGRDRLEMTPEGEWVRKLTSDCVNTMLVGVRYISIGEGFDWNSLAVESGNRDAATGEYNVNTLNKMLGIQWGHELTLQRSKWRFGVRNKIGSYINYASQHSRVEIIDPTFGDQFRNETASSHDLSFIYDLHLMFAYHFRPNIAIRSGYDFMFINQLALAPDQLTFTPAPTSRVVDGGALLYNGVSLGFEMVW